MHLVTPLLIFVGAVFLIVVAFVVAGNRQRARIDSWLERSADALCLPLTQDREFRIEGVVEEFQLSIYSETRTGDVANDGYIVFEIGAGRMPEELGSGRWARRKRDGCDASWSLG